MELNKYLLTNRILIYKKKYRQNYYFNFLNYDVLSNCPFLVKIFDQLHPRGNNLQGFPIGVTVHDKDQQICYYRIKATYK